MSGPRASGIQSRGANNGLAIIRGYREGIVFMVSFYERLKFNQDGLIPAIIQDQASGRVLMMAWMNQASLQKTIETGKTHFWSRSRQKFWMKGESSGHTQ